jgi:hypothetical protein
MGLWNTMTAKETKISRCRGKGCDDNEKLAACGVSITSVEDLNPLLSAVLDSSEVASAFSLLCQEKQLVEP